MDLLSGFSGKMKKFRLEYMIVIAIVVIIVGITIYSGELPPVSVVESESMQHSSSWMPGVINTGDIVIVKKITDPIKDIVTYVQGRSDGFETYGEYGNVILYHDPSIGTVIHRAMFYLFWNGSHPEVMGYHGQSWIVITKSYVLIKDVGYAHKNLLVLIGAFKGEDGYITVGDHNLGSMSRNSFYYNSTLNAYIAADQNTGITSTPVLPSMVIGIAEGQIPWFGLIKLNIMRLEGKWPYYNEVPNGSYLYLFLSITGILVLIFFPYKKAARKIRQRWKK